MACKDAPDIEDEIVQYLRSNSQRNPLSCFAALKNFENLKTNCQRVNFAYTYFSLLHPFSHEKFVLPKVRKCDIKSTKLREEGNLMFRRKKDVEALILYTESIGYAENNSSYLGLAYGNRSAVLFEKGYYKECLEDISRALQNNFPDHLREKLLTRQKRAEILIKKNPKTFCYYEPAPSVTKKHPRISAAADCVELNRNECFGTHVITTRNVEAGEVISVEKPYVQKVSPESKFLHCHECLELCFNMIPCENCATALYCSPDCRTIAFTSYHRHECDFGTISGEITLFLKTTLLGAVEYKNLKNGTNSNNAIYRSDRYKEVYDLETNENLWNTVILFNGFVCAIIAGITFQCVKYRTSFLQENDLDENTLKGIILHNILIEAMNNIEISKTNYWLMEVEHGSVGRAIYSFSSRFNHSCAPNCMITFYGTTAVLTVVKDIKKREQCTISYGWIYTRTSRVERQALLKETYLFSCRCIACENFWPTYPNDTILIEHGIASLMCLSIIGDNEYASSATDLVSLLLSVASGIPTKEQKEGILSKCFHLQRFFVEPSESVDFLNYIVRCMSSLSANHNVKF